MKKPLPSPATETLRDRDEEPSPEDREIRASVGVAARAVLEKKGEALRVLRLADVTTFTDYFVLASGRSVPHVRTLVEAVEEKLREAGRRPLHSEGRSSAHWVLLDYGDFVAHVFLGEHRDFYGLDRLWGDAPEVTDRILEA